MRIPGDESSAAARHHEATGSGNNPAALSPAADSLAEMRALLQSDREYADELGISRRGVDFINGAEATLRAARASL
ncbi:hypothetical protein CGQ24_07435 [Arthrobacter sp. 7749]|nr:hypothetical protein CGQ24_07435 [Arthrobacter sp. 7749]